MSDKKFYGQQCQDEKINKTFRHLHENLVNEIIGFCRAYGISIDEFHMNADCLEDSIKAGSWQPSTDSGLSFYKFTDEWKDIMSMKKKVSKEEYNKVKLEQKPFLFSM